ncbi:hypothetical protein BpHYR1_029138 [Brachionus plicatilis]|uniref:Uncharacterized protein n=1 Tax=Brachionus plicatilis TaxID=10195 RepID=A0A3M7QT19_BRAPC|nr:hypothetical protein BpHYR1_029138 [Brachionus plicatilis]
MKQLLMIAILKILLNLKTFKNNFLISMRNDSFYLSDFWKLFNVSIFYKIYLIIAPNLKTLSSQKNACFLICGFIRMIFFRYFQKFKNFIS